MRTVILNMAVFSGWKNVQNFNKNGQIWTSFLVLFNMCLVFSVYKVFFRDFHFFSPNY